MNNKLSESKLIKLVLDSFEAEKSNDVSIGTQLITKDFKMRSMSVYNKNIFPVFGNGELLTDLKKAFSIKGKEFCVWNCAANVKTQTVFVELAEVEPTKKGPIIWPYALICQIENGKIKRSRHYGDPALLKENLSIQDIRSVIEE